jgi:hypothetical protein
MAERFSVGGFMFLVRPRVELVNPMYKFLLVQPKPSV